MDEQAFPMMTHDDPLYGGRIVGQRGMTLRDYFAAQIAAGLSAYSGTEGISFGPYNIAGRSYEVADAMMKARKELEDKKSDD